MKVILIRGNSASGKTTLANRIKDVLENSVLISRDVLRQTTASENLPDALINAVKQAEADFYDYAIVEGILPAEKYASFFRFLKQNFEVHAYYYDLPFSETLRRHKTRKYRQSFGVEEMLCWYHFRDLIGDVPEQIITQKDSISTALIQICKDLGHSYRTQH